ncbi:acyl-CoA dehydrogenase family protein [Sneathiella sp.]|uniref:acyl-CoA dehydrogenase family protein n=1 Tax=Sneathiella sp. TaxID=1964365 RepID=UPI0035682D2C
MGDKKSNLIVSKEQLDSVLDTVVEKLAAMGPDIDKKGSYPYEGVELLKESGIINAFLPKEYGGLGLGVDGDYCTYFHTIERVSSGCSNVGQLLLVQAASMNSIYDLGSKKQIKFFSEEIREKGSMFCYLGSEPADRFTSDNKRARMDSSVTRVDGGWSINAKKAFATGSVGSTYSLIFCMEDGEQDPSKMVVVGIPTSDPSVTVIDSWDNMGQRATTSGMLEIKDGFISDDFTFGPPGTFSKSNVLAPIFQLSFAAALTGIAQGAMNFVLDFSANHQKPTVGFERVADEPTIQNHVGEMATDIMAARALVNRAARMLEEVGQGGGNIPEMMVAVYMAKTFTHRMSVNVCTKIFQLTGARSTTARFGADRFWRNARTLSLHDNLDKQQGTIGRYVLGVEIPKMSTR